MLYGVETKNLKRQVKRNLARFPEDFMFEISKEELENLRCQFGTSSWGGTRYSPMAFSEQGVAMLSSVLNSETAIEVNIQIIRIFNRFRETISVHQDIFLKLEKIENELTSNHKTNLKHDEEIQVIFSALKKLLNSPKKERESLGYKVK
ncbi:MAG: ORF6N domain-containing protein [Bacteroidota bacterium]